MQKSQLMLQELWLQQSGQRLCMGTFPAPDPCLMRTHSAEGGVEICSGNAPNGRKQWPAHAGQDRAQPLSALFSLLLYCPGSLGKGPAAPPSFRTHQDEQIVALTGIAFIVELPVLTSSNKRVQFWNCKLSFHGQPNTAPTSFLATMQKALPATSCFPPTRGQSRPVPCSLSQS